MKKLSLILLSLFFITSASSTVYGAADISGTVSYTGAVTGTILVAAFTNQQFDSDPIAMTQLSSPGSYTISGLADGTYYMVSSIATQVQDGYFIQKTDPWGVYGTWGNLTPVTITGGTNVSGVNITLVNGTTENPNPFSEEEKQYSTSTNSQNWNNGNYTVQLSVEDPNHKATSVAVTGPGITGSLLLDYNANEKRWSSWQANKDLAFGSNPPTPPLTYTYTIIDPDSTTVKTDVMESFVSVCATGLSPSKGQTVTNPISFSWTGVGSGYTYQVQISDANWNRIWNSNDKLTTTSVQYDGSALISGTQYSYWVVVEDMHGNASFAAGSFLYYVVGTGSISGTVSYSGAAKGAVVLAAFTTTDFKNSHSAAEIKLDSPGSYTLSGLSDGKYFIASVLFTLGYIPDTNNTILKTDPWGVYGTLGNLTPVTITGGGAVSGKDLTLIDGTDANPNPFSEETGVTEDMPSAFRLSQNFPNPFNPVTTIEYSVPQSQFVTLKIFNTLGEEVATLVEGKVASGSHTAAWNATGYASGIYFYQLEAGSTRLTKKLLLMK
ncbi:MAG: T9SS type A sorting domain-containing protein [Candidatus Latescibacterota bacterium]